MGCFPENLCYETQGGDDPDLVTWEQSYFCKRSNEQEMVVRSALWSKSRALYLEHTSGVATVTCPAWNITGNETGINPNWETWDPKTVPGLKLWTPTEDWLSATKKWKVSIGSQNSYTSGYGGITGNEVNFLH